MSQTPAAPSTETVSTYLERLASGDATPGGGAAAALTGAQAAALLSMVVHISSKNAQTTPTFTRLLNDLERLRRTCEQLADDDCVAFSAVMQAYAMPGASASDKQTRSEALQKALKNAARVPLSLLQVLGKLHDTSKEVIGLAKPNVISDAAIALHLLGAALRAATCNVKINLKYIRDADFNSSANRELKSARAGRRALRQNLLKEAHKHF